MEVITVFIAHSYPLVRKGMSCVIAEDPELALLAEAADAASAIRGICRLRPHVGLVELNATDQGGISVCEAMRTKGMATKIILLATEARGEDVYRAITAGASGYLTGAESIEDILKATKGAAKDAITISADAQAILQKYLREKQAESQADSDTLLQPVLSETELRILHYMAEGLSISETGRAMHLSTSTVKNHRQNLFAKLGVPNAPAAVYSGVQRGILGRFSA